MRKFKVAAVGAGYFSQFHFDAWSRMENVAMVAVCDVDAASAESTAQRYQIPARYTDFGKMLDQERPDWVDIITPPASHLELVRAAVDRGIAVICQKPLAPTIADAEQMVEVAEAANVPLMVHENFRFQPWYREIRRQIDQGAIGDRLHSLSFRCRMGDGWQKDAYLARQPYFRSMPRLLVFETGVHFVDTFRYLAGEIEGVFAFTDKLNPQIAGEDAALVMFEFSSGTRGIWDGNRYNESTSANPRLTFGELTVDGNDGTLRLSDDATLTLQPLGDSVRTLSYSWRDHAFSGDCVLKTQQHFVEQLEKGKPFETNGRDYLRTLRVVEAIYDSARTGMPVRGLAEKTPCE